MVSNSAVIRNPAVGATPKAQRIALPPWAFGNSGTPFKIFFDDRIVAERVGGHQAGRGA